MGAQSKSKEVRLAVLLWSVVSAALFLNSGPIWSQIGTVDEHEKSIASLPLDQRAYERFRLWSTTLPPDQQRDPRLLTRYRQYLKARGFSDGDADTQIKIVRTQGSRAEAERWNRILTAENPTFNVKPNEFLVEMAKGRKPGTALDVGMGQGRNAIWLAQQGWDVTGFDPAEKAVVLAQETARKLGVRFRSEITGMEDFDFGISRWDMIVLSYVGGREMPLRFIAALLAFSCFMSAADPAIGSDGFESGVVTTSDGIRLHYLESGNGPAILFVPGWTGAAEFWAPLIRLLSGSHRVIAIDPRSQGDSEKPTKETTPSGALAISTKS